MLRLSKNYLKIIERELNYHINYSFIPILFPEKKDYVFLGTIKEYNKKINDIL